MSICKLQIIETDGLDDCLGRQAVKTAKGKVIFQVTDLTYCPEDATIYRDLFNAEQYIKTLKLGMQLAEHGYDDIEVERIEVHSSDKFYDLVH